MTQDTGVRFNKGQLAVCRDCCEPLKFIWKAGVRDFCVDCEAIHAKDAWEEAKRIARNKNRR